MRILKSIAPIVTYRQKIGFNAEVIFHHLFMREGRVLGGYKRFEQGSWGFDDVL